jgi:hypothetical protein
VLFEVLRTVDFFCSFGVSVEGFDGDRARFIVHTSVWYLLTSLFACFNLIIDTIPVPVPVPVPGTSTAGITCAESSPPYKVK